MHNGPYYWPDSTSSCIKPGKTMGKSDMLSQRSDHGLGTEDNQNLTLLTPGLFSMRALEGVQVTGEEKDILREI